MNTTANNPPHSSIVIRAYNEEEHIGRLLTGILNQTLSDFEIILVDSGSTDATLAIASRFPVQVISIKPEEFTFGRSLNIGCQQAQGEFIILASAHVYPVYEDWLEQLLDPFKNKDIALVYGKQRGNKSTKFSEHEQFAKMFPDASSSVQEHPLCNNANAAIRRALWQNRPYNEDLSGLEDLEWAMWAISQGYGLSYSSEAEVIHVHDESPRQVYNRYRREAVALKAIQPEEHFYLWDFLRLYIANVRSDLLHALRQRVFLSNIRGILWFRWAQFWGTYRGYSYRGPVTRQLIQTFYYPRSFARESHPPNRDIQVIDYGSSQSHSSDQENSD